MAFVISFLLLSMLWVIHLQQFRSLARADGVLLWLNNIRLLFIVLIPFTTSLVSEYNDYYAGRMLLPDQLLLRGALRLPVLGVGGVTRRPSADRGSAARRPAAGPRRSAAPSSAVPSRRSLSPWLGSWGFLAYVFNAPLTRLLQRRERARQEAGA